MTTVAVVIPAYNAEKFLSRAIESALAQTSMPDEIIVVDDGSDDATSSVVGRYSGVQLIRQENRGLSAARNTGIRAAKSDYIALLDADDWWEPTHLENARKAWKTGARWTASAWVRTDGSARLVVKPFKTTGPREYLRVAAYRNVIVPSGVTAERNLLLSVGGFPEEIRRHAEDKIAWAKLSAISADVFFIAEPTLDYFQHEGSITKLKTPPEERVRIGLARAQTLLYILASHPSPRARKMARGTALRSAQSLMRLNAELPETTFRRVLSPLGTIPTHLLLFAARFRLARRIVSRCINLLLRVLP